MALMRSASRQYRAQSSRSNKGRAAGVATPLSAVAYGVSSF